MSFVVGAVIGAVVCGLVMGRRRPALAPAVVLPPPAEAVQASGPAAPATPNAAAEATAAEAASPEVALADPESVTQVGEKVADVVAELERRVKGRRPETDPERPAGSRGGQADSGPLAAAPDEGGGRGN